MSDYICFELQTEIIKRLPLKSLVKFKTVSKPWKSLIDSSEFMADYKHHQEPLLIISHSYSDRSDIQYISLLDDQNFLQHKFSTDDYYMLRDDKNVASSHGLFCFYHYYRDFKNHRLGKIVLWNPLIRKTVTIDVPWEHGYFINLKSTVGFGVCPRTLDPMVVKITRFSFRLRPWISVFTFSSREWETQYFDPPRDNIEFTDSYVSIDGFIYWCAYKRITWDFQDNFNLIISFNMSLTSREVKEIYLPDSLAQKNRLNLSISNLRESLVVLDYYEEVAKRRVCDVWMMIMADHHGVPNSFTKLYTIKPTDATSVLKVLGFMNSGSPIIEKQNDDGVDSSAVAVYEIDSQQMRDIGVVNGKKHSFSVHSYKETLLLLNQPDKIYCWEYFNF